MTTNLIGTVWRRPFEGTEWRVVGEATLNRERFVQLKQVSPGGDYLRHVTPRDLRRWYTPMEAK